MKIVEKMGYKPILFYYENFLANASKMLRFMPSGAAGLSTYHIVVSFHHVTGFEGDWATLSHHRAVQINGRDEWRLLHDAKRKRENIKDREYP